MWRWSQSPSPGPRSPRPGSPAGASWQSPHWLELLLQRHLMLGWLKWKIPQILIFQALSSVFDMIICNYDHWTILVRHSTDDCCSTTNHGNMSKAWKWCSSYQHCSRVRKSNTFLDFITCSRLYSSWNCEYLHRQSHGTQVVTQLNSFQDIWRQRVHGGGKQELTGCWWNVCGFSMRFWQSVLVLCLNKNSGKVKTNIIAPNYCASLGCNY